VNELFGLSMTTIMLILVAAFACCAVAVVVIYLSGRLMFRMGLRNVRRRRAQSTLVVSGLMLATVIITAAFTTGDTLDYSITTVAFDTLQRTDLSLHHFRSADGQQAASGQSYAPDYLTDRLSAAFQDDPDIEGFVPFLFEPLPALDVRTRLTEPVVLLAGADPASIDRFGGIRLLNGQRADLAALADDEVFANERAVEKMDVRAGDDLTVWVHGEPLSLRVAGIVRSERATGKLEIGAAEAPGFVTKLSTAQRISGHAGEINSISVVLRGGVRGSIERTEPAAKRLEEFVATPEGKNQLGLGSAGFQVEQVKKDVVDEAKLTSSLFTTLFLVLGLFSIAAGVLLIFMIFVMLAAERRQEMGIARAVGAERLHLVQSFLAEGMFYDLVAGIVGVVLGVAFGFAVIVGGSRLAFGDELSFVRPHVTARTLVVSFCLGFVLTFITVVASSIYVSRLNIVAAIRGQAESGRRRDTNGFSWHWVLISIAILFILPPLGLYWLLRRGLGLSLAWSLIPLEALGGVLLLVAGRMTGSSFLFSTGISLVPLAIAQSLRVFNVNSRAVWTGLGVVLLGYWLMPWDVGETLFGSFKNSGMEMFVLSGIMIVTALTLIIVFNARLLEAMYSGASHGRRGYMVPLAMFVVVGLLAAGGALIGKRGGGMGDIAYLLALIAGIAATFSLIAQRFPSLTPALKMGIAYPLANRFRTGMTIAMFALILFSLTVMSVMNASFMAEYLTDEGTASWDLAVSANRNNPIDDLRTALDAEGSFDTSRIAAIGRLTPMDDDRQRVRQPGEEEWQQYIVRAGDDAFWTQTQMKLSSRARGYGTDGAVFQAVRTGPFLALVDSSVVASLQFGDTGFKVPGITIENATFDPFEVEIRDEATGTVARVTVIGVLSSRILMFPGVFINDATSRELFGPPDYRDFLVRLRPGTDAAGSAKTIRAALVTSGVDAVSIKSVIDEAMGQSRGFFRFMQLFMGLGLFVGIAAVGVISLRSVVERRQQIGMLRAIGYERSTVAFGFLFETAFIALMGIGSGVGGAVLLSRNIVTADEFTNQAAATSLYVPWPEVLVFISLAFTFALLMTWWPSRRAASVAIAEALRYE
jgi:putative ABC transport system permease protein